jgi:hypothetical protein
LARNPAISNTAVTLLNSVLNLFIKSSFLLLNA